MTKLKEALEKLLEAAHPAYVSDFVGNTGALIDGQFVWDEVLRS